MPGRISYWRVHSNASVRRLVKLQMKSDPVTRSLKGQALEVLDPVSGIVRFDPPVYFADTPLLADYGITRIKRSAYYGRRHRMVKRLKGKG